METILETISVASEELDEIPLYEIIIETIDSQEDEIIFDATPIVTGKLWFL